MSILKPLIVLFGPDGCGKSTNAKILASYLEENGIKVHVSWISSHHLLAYLVRRVFIALGAYVWEKDGTLVPTKNLSWGVVNTKIGKKIWLYIEFLSLILIIILKVQIPRILGKVVVVERYIPSSIVDLTYMLGESVLYTFPLKLLLKMAGKNSIFVFLCCDWNTHKKRRHGMVESRRYMEHQERMYLTFARHYSSLKIDTSTTSIPKTHAIIRKNIPWTQ